MNKKYRVYVLVKGQYLFVNFSEEGNETIHAMDVKSTNDFWFDNNKENLEFMLLEYEKRLEGFRVAELEITETFDFKEM